MFTERRDQSVYKTQPICSCTTQETPTNLTEFIGIHGVCVRLIVQLIFQCVAQRKQKTEKGIFDFRYLALKAVL